jgi:glycosyltransferase involved in cell wall biosynthesis
MKILWITNTIIGDMYEKIHGKKSNGLWMDALLNDFAFHGEHDLIIATSGRVKKAEKHYGNKVTYYLMPGGYPIEYKCSTSSVNEWHQLLSAEKPDIIQIWGTEFLQGLCALKADVGIPSVIYMQGLLESIARYYESGIPHSVLKKYVSVHDILKRDSMLQQQCKYQRRAEYEKEMLALSTNIISENEWCNAHIKALVPNIHIYNCPLSINPVFSQFQWNISDVNQHSIVCNASGYPIKGLHILLHALALVRQSYPDVRLYVPGTPQVQQASVKKFLKQSGYSKYIEAIIKQFKLENNVAWLGNLPQEQLAQQYSKSHVFVLCSAIENHSSSLKEAMITGVPSIASAVGGIPEYAINGENAILYRFEEYELLAEHIKQIFQDDDLAISLSQKARISMMSLHESANTYNTILRIYDDVIASKNEGYKT